MCAVRASGAGDDGSTGVIGRLSPFWIAAAVFLLDHVTKLSIRARVGVWDNFPVVPGFFSIVHAENPGAAFSIFADSSSPLRPFLLIALSLGVMAFITILLLKPVKDRVTATWMLRAGLALVLGGAMGNVYDRIVRGSVTDFLEFYFGSYTFPAFNVADSAITVGAAALLIDMWITSRRSRGEHVPQTD
jgi:signal peptidase II